MTHLAGVTIRSTQAEDLAQVVNLDRLSFAPLSANAEIEQDWFQGSLEFPDHTTFLAIDNATSSGIGSYTQLSLSTFFEKKIFPLMGIGTVAVAPHRRGQKIAQWMIEHALQSAAAQQIPLVMLYPFQHGFYRKLGWAWVGCPHQYRVSTRHIPAYSERSNIVPYQASQHQAAAQLIYQKAASQHNGWLHRQDWHWKSRLKPSKGREVYVYVEAEELIGYVILQFTLLEPPQNVLAVVVQEWVAPTAAAYRGIVGFLSSLRDQVSTIVWNTYPGDPFPYLLKEQRLSAALAATPSEFGLTHRFGELGGGFMWRLVDLETAFRLRPIRQGSSFALMFQVADPVLGDRPISVEFSDGRMQMIASATTVVKISIEHLTELFCGFRHAANLLWTGELEVEGDTSLLTRLDAVWQAAPPFCWDFF